jgi:hypothetical protein
MLRFGAASRVADLAVADRAGAGEAEGVAETITLRAGLGEADGVAITAWMSMLFTELSKPPPSSAAPKKPAEFS